jgi:hypothetical protein
MVTAAKAPKKASGFMLVSLEIETLNNIVSTRNIKIRL